MTCPRCGYVRSEFDAHCLRCRLLAAEGRSSRHIPPAEQTVVMSDFHGPDSLPFPPQPAIRLPRLSRAWITALLVILALAAGVLAGRLTGTSRPPGSGLTANASAPSARG